MAIGFQAVSSVLDIVSIIFEGVEHLGVSGYLVEPHHYALRGIPIGAVYRHPRMAAYLFDRQSLVDIDTQDLFYEVLGWF